MTSKFTNSVSQVFKYFTPTSARGCWVNILEKPYKILDLTGGIGALSLGHSHEIVNKEVITQCKTMVHCSQQVFGGNLQRDQLIKKMSNFTHKKLDRYYFTTSGSESTDNALKIARRYTGRNSTVVVKKGFHGRTLCALSLSSSNPISRNKIGPLLSNVYYCDDNIESFYNIFEQHILPNDVAAFMFESIQGEGGIFNLDESFLKEATEFCKQNGIIVIADEVQCGIGRTGSYWNITQKDIVPDILTFGKGIANGYPLSGLISSANIIDDNGPNFLGGTYGGNPIMCAAANATIDVFENETILENVKICESYLKSQLDLINGIRNTRIYGLMVGLDIEKDSHYVVDKLAKNGVCVLKAGNRGQYIRLLPPLNITKEELDIFLEQLEYVLNSD